MSSELLKIIEIWRPSNDGQSLELYDGYFGKYKKFKNETLQHKFVFDMGLPGKAWSTAQPQFISNLEHSYFQRKTTAIDMGLTSGLALPIFSGEFLISVVVFLFGGGRKNEGAIELWAVENKKSSKISLVDGYYGYLRNLEQTSRATKFARGQGLPGMVWDYQMPMLISNPAKSSLFIRASNSTIDNVTSALGFPFRNKKKDYVISFLTSNGTSIARRYEIWMPDRNHEYLFLQTADCVTESDLHSKYKHKKIRRGVGLKGKVWLTGCPAITNELVADELVQFNMKDKFETGMVMPIIDNGFLSSLIVFIF